MLSTQKRITPTKFMMDYVSGALEATNDMENEPWMSLLWCDPAYDLSPSFVIIGRDSLEDL